MKRRASPTLSVIYLLVLAVAVFILRDIRLLAAAFGLQLVLGLIAGAGLKALSQPFRKLAVLSLCIVISYSLLGVGMRGPAATVELPLWPWPVSVTGALFGVAMVLRIWTVVTASVWVRQQGEPGAFVAGLRRLGMPAALAELLDRSLLMLEARPDLKKKHGQGGGHGRKKNKEAGLAIRQLLRGDMTVLVEKLEGSLQAASRVDKQSATGSSRDLAILSGLLLFMLSIKALKILPGLPFAPGHKGIVLIPLYLMAAHLTERRGGATLLGTAFGLLSFLFGDGRYGVFEILKHLTPGILADLLRPLLRSKRHALLIYAAAGVIIAAGRWGTIAAIVLLVEAPGVLVAALFPVGLIHVAFGALSGVVTRALLGASDRFHRAVSEPDAGNVETHPVPEKGGAAPEGKERVS